MTETQPAAGENSPYVAANDAIAAQLRDCLGVPAAAIYSGFDDLTSGPLAPLTDLDHWQVLRDDFWRAGTGPVYFLAGGAEPQHPNDLLTRLRADRDRLGAADTLFLGFGTELREQLSLAWMVELLARLEVGTETVRLLEIKPYRGRPEHSMAAFNCETVRELCRWRPPAAGELDSYRAAWSVVSGGSPEALVAFCAPETLHPAALEQALRALMARYPAPDRGLNLWERRLLENCRHQFKSARVVGFTLAAAFDSDSPDHVGDYYLFERLRRLADSALAHPLLSFRGDPFSGSPEGPLRKTEVAITDVGERVLRGDADCIDLNGIDDWVGGVHLSAAEGRVWRFDGETLVKG